LFSGFFYLSQNMLYTEDNSGFFYKYEETHHAFGYGVSKPIVIL